MKNRVIFRADGNGEIGYGHFIRTLAIAGLINDSFDCIYAAKKPTPYQLQEIFRVCKDVIELSDDDSHFNEFLTHLKKGDIVVLDGYYFSSEYQNTIRNYGCKVVYIDDFSDRHYVCDALINNIPGNLERDFKTEKYTKLYLGTDYALLRQEFLNPQLREIKKDRSTVFLAFGGADVLNISEKIVNYINETCSGAKINLLIGDAYKHQASLQKYKNVTTHKNISAEEVSQLIASSRICIIPASSLLNEAACIGSHVLLGYFTDNQIQPYNHFVENKLAIGLGDYRNLELEEFKIKFADALNADYLIDNQRSVYHYQQIENLKNIFHEL